MARREKIGRFFGLLLAAVAVLFALMTITGGLLEGFSNGDWRFIPLAPVALLLAAVYYQLGRDIYRCGL